MPDKVMSLPISRVQSKFIPWGKFIAVYFLLSTVYPQCVLIPALSVLSFSGSTLLVHADSLRELQKVRTDWKQAVLYHTTVPNPDTDTLFLSPTLVFICSLTQ